MPRAVRYDNIFRVTIQKRLSFYIMLYRLFNLVTNHSLHGNIFRHLDDALRSSTWDMKATQTNTEESERDTERGNSEQKKDSETKRGART